MRTTIEKNLWQNSLSQIIERIDTDIFDEKIWIWEKMWKIAEVTYSYTSKDKKTWKNIFINNKEIDLNYTLFCEIWGLNLEDFEELSDNEKIEKILKSAKTLNKKISEKRKKILEILSNLEQLEAEDKQEKFKIKIIKESLEEKINLLDYCSNWIFYELEKAWVMQVSNEKSEEIDKKQKNLDKILFWWEVKENQEEINLCYNNLLEIFQTNIENFSESEKAFFEEILEKIWNLSTKNQEKSLKKAERNDYLEEFSNISFDTEKYISLFNFLAEINQIPHKAVKNEEAWSISDGPKTVEFPKKYKNFKFPRFAKLNHHEFETHSITDFNNSLVMGNLRWAKSIEKDEGLAIFMENILQYGTSITKKDEASGKIIFDIEKFNFPKTIVFTLVWEILNSKEFFKFLELLEKNWLIIGPTKDRFLRQKRSNKAWVQHKDTSYARWLFKIVSEINDFIISDWKKWTNFYDFFAWKCSIEDSKEFALLHKNGFNKPQFTSDLMIFILKNQNPTEENFYDFLQKKYPFINFSEEKIRAIRHSTIKNNNFNENVSKIKKYLEEK